MSHFPIQKKMPASHRQDHGADELTDDEFAPGEVVVLHMGASMEASEGDGRNNATSSSERDGLFQASSSPTRSANGRRQFVHPALESSSQIVRTLHTTLLPDDCLSLTLWNFCWGGSHDRLSQSDDDSGSGTNAGSRSKTGATRVGPRRYKYSIRLFDCPAAVKLLKFITLTVALIVSIYFLVRFMVRAESRTIRMWKLCENSGM
jgi:hypothetical protein